MFPNDRAAEIAVETVKKTLSDCKNVNRVVFNVFKDIDYEIYNRLLEN
jgi:O-acetyl-ADP-ribose deacetylase (regulator of RNase III)